MNCSTVVEDSMPVPPMCADGNSRRNVSRAFALHPKIELPQIRSYSGSNSSRLTHFVKFTSAPWCLSQDDSFIKAKFGSLPSMWVSLILFPRTSSLPHGRTPVRESNWVWRNKTTAADGSLGCNRGVIRFVIHVRLAFFFNIKNHQISYIKCLKGICYVSTSIVSTCIISTWVSK